MVRAHPRVRTRACARVTINNISHTMMTTMAITSGAAAGGPTGARD